MIKLSANLIKKNIFIFVLVAFPSPEIKAEITNKAILSNAFNDCLEQDSYPNGVGTQYAYCGCFVNKISKGMSTKEFIKIGLTLQEEENTKKHSKILLSNKKIKEYIVDCMTSAFEQ